MHEVNYEPVIRDMTWSHSRLTSFDSCPYRWYLKYLRGVKGVPLFFSEYGKLIHELLADFYAGRKTGDEIYIEYLTQFRKRVPPGAPSRTVFSHYFSDGARFLSGIQMLKYKVIAVEQKLNFTVGGYSFIGFLDLLCEDENGDLVIIDNKSRNLRHRSNRGKKTKYDEELDEYLRQLYLYAAAVEQSYGRKPVLLCFNCFREGELIEEPFNEVVYQNVLKDTAKAIERIAKEEDFDPSIEFFKCNYLCDAKNSCEYFALAGR